MHLQEAYRFLGCEKGCFPVAETCAEEFLSLPMFPELTNAQIHAVADELKIVHQRQKARQQLSKMMPPTAT